MSLEIVEEPPARLAEYATIPIRFEVVETFDAAAVEAMTNGARPASVPVDEPYEKDYDAYPGGHPNDWPARFDLSHWTVLVARLDGARVGGAVVITGDVQPERCESADVAVLWDLRVALGARRRGVGAALLRAAEHAAARRGAQILRAETQQVNVPACRFYQRHGFTLARASEGAYSTLPAEVQLLWTKPLVWRPHSSG